VKHASIFNNIMKTQQCSLSIQNTRNVSEYLQEHGEFTEKLGITLLTVL